MDKKKLITSLIIGLSVLFSVAAEKPTEKRPIVYVMGAVNAPSGIPYSATLTLQDAIKKAGGLTRRGDRQHIELRIGGNEKSVITINLDDILSGKIKEPAISDGDLILVLQKKAVDG